MSKYYSFIEIQNNVNNLPHGDTIYDAVVKGIRKYGMDRDKVYGFAGPYPSSWNVEFDNIWAMMTALNREDYRRLVKIR